MPASRRPAHGLPAQHHPHGLRQGQLDDVGFGGPRCRTRCKAAWPSGCAGRPVASPRQQPGRERATVRSGNPSGPICPLSHAHVHLYPCGGEHCVCPGTARSMPASVTQGSRHGCPLARWQTLGTGVAAAQGDAVATGDPSPLGARAELWAPMDVPERRVSCSAGSWTSFAQVHCMFREPAPTTALLDRTVRAPARRSPVLTGVGQRALQGDL